MTSVDTEGNGFDGQAGAITTASGFDDFADLPKLVSAADIKAYDDEVIRLEGLETAASKAVTDYTSGVTTGDTRADLLQAITDAQNDINAFDAEVTRLEGLETAAKNAVTDYTSGVTTGLTRADMVSDKGVAEGNLTAHTDVPRPVLTDVDFYADMTHLLNSKIVSGLGTGATDAFGQGYDVITSAQVDSFAGDPNLEFTMRAIMTTSSTLMIL